MWKGNKMTTYSEKMIQAQAVFDASMEQPWMDYMAGDRDDIFTYDRAEKEASRVYAETMGSDQ
jgi:hypothetical protein